MNLISTIFIVDKSFCVVTIEIERVEVRKINIFGVTKNLNWFLTIVFPASISFSK